jgi:hypothetical protein
MTEVRQPHSITSSARPSNVAELSMPDEPVAKPKLGSTIPLYVHFIPERNGVIRVLGATYQWRVQGNGTGPRAWQLQDKVGGVVPAALLLIERRAAAPVISVHCTVGCESTP